MGHINIKEVRQYKNGSCNQEDNFLAPSYIQQIEQQFNIYIHLFTSAITYYIDVNQTTYISDFQN